MMKNGVRFPSLVEGTKTLLEQRWNRRDGEGVHASLGGLGFQNLSNFECTLMHEDEDEDDGDETVRMMKMMR